MTRVLVLALGAIGFCACEPIAPATGRVDIVAGGLIGNDDDSERMTLDLELANGTEDTVFLYGSVRRVQYDATTNRTTLELRSRHCEGNPTIDAHWLLPPSHAIGPRSFARIEIPTPRSYHELSREVPVAAASALAVELAWTDRDFAQHGPGCLPDALLALERGVAKKTVTP